MKHTSSELQKRFPEVYKDFFAQNDLVVSGHFSIKRGVGGLGERSKNPQLMNKIPLKIYVGISKKGI